jgi:hypothetical protein
MHVLLMLDPVILLVLTELVLPLGRVADICVDEEAIHFRVHILHGNLKAVEAACLRHLDLLAESLNKVLVYDPVGGGEEGKYVRDKMSLTIL